MTTCLHQLQLRRPVLCAQWRTEDMQLDGPPQDGYRILMVSVSDSNGQVTMNERE